MSWTQKKLEELYREINRRLAEEPEFAEKLRKDPGKTLEELAGQPLPEGFSLQLVEKDDNYDQTYVLPDFAGEEIAFSDLDDVALACEDPVAAREDLIETFRDLNVKKGDPIDKTYGEIVNSSLHNTVAG